METREYRTIDKSDWPRGEWDEEPDKKQWQDEETGLPCLLVRNPVGGNLCGYVGVPPGHPWHGKGYDRPDLYDDDAHDVHGGLTFADACADTDDESRHICHVPGPGEPDNVWWFGFDCAHSFDLSPKYSRDFAIFGEAVYRTKRYVEAHCRRLAKVLRAAA